MKQTGLKKLANQQINKT